MATSPTASSPTASRSGSSVCAKPSRSDLREQAILDAVIELLSDIGYERMTMDAVATTARASKATIYRKWNGKPELVVDALRRCHAFDIELVDTGSVRGDLLYVLRASMEQTNTSDLPLLAGLTHAMQTDAELATVLRQQLLHDRKHLDQELVRRAIARGELGAGTDPNLLYEIVPGQVAMRMLMLGEPADDAYLVHLVDDIIIPVLVHSGRRG